MTGWRDTYRVGWFRPNAAGGFPVPDRWPGWLVTAALIAGLATCVLLPREDRGAVAGVLLLAYAGVIYWTYSAD